MPTAEPLLGPSPLEASHFVDDFDCGDPALNDYLTRWALCDQTAGKSRTYVAARGRRVVALFSLAAADVVPADATGRAARGQGSQHIPAILLARLAVDSREQGGGIGRALVLDALARCEQAAEVVGVRVVLVHAKDDRVRAFYARLGFEPTPTDPLHLMILMKDVRATLAGE